MNTTNTNNETLYILITVNAYIFMSIRFIIHVSVLFLIILLIGRKPLNVRSFGPYILNVSFLAMIIPDLLNQSIYGSWIAVTPLLVFTRLFVYYPLMYFFKKIKN
jgi:uncharacterized membrane protein YcaP (DUF421 family)